MRMSRKRRRRLEKPAELAEPEERSISSFRMTRKRLRKRRAEKVRKTGTGKRVRLTAF